MKFKRYLTEKTYTVYHGTKNTFDTFDTKKIGSATDSGMYGKGFYFTDDLKYAKTYGKIMTIELQMKKPYILKKKSDIPQIDVPQKTMKDLMSADTNYSYMFREYIISKGYDGVIDMINKPYQYIVYNPKQIKVISN